MAEVNAKVMEMVKSELKKNPDISNKELLQKATSIDKSVGKLSARQFNATYPLQVKRAMAPPRKRSAKKRGKKSATKRSGGARASGKRGAGRKAAKGRAAAPAGGSNSRDQVRKVLVQLARDVAEGDRGALVEVAAGIDRYVDRVLKATS